MIGMKVALGRKVFSFLSLLYYIVHTLVLGGIEIVDI
jgi:hypothetical protein